MPAAPKIIRTGDDKVDRSMQSLSAAVRELGEPVVENGGQLDGVVLTTGTTHVAHKLGRKWRGWMVVDASASVQVWRDASSDLTPERTLPLVASSGATVSLWVF